MKTTTEITGSDMKEARSFDSREGPSQDNSPPQQYKSAEKLDLKKWFGDVKVITLEKFPKRWQAFQERDSGSLGCCTPNTVTITWSYHDYSAGGLLRTYTETLSRADYPDCTYYYRDTPRDCPYYYYFQGYEFIGVQWDGYEWHAFGGETCFASSEEAFFGTDPCNPVGTAASYTYGNPTGRTWTLS